MSTESIHSPAVITSEALREHFQGHRRLTRRVIEAFPEDRFLTFSLGGMRPFGEMVAELLAMATPLFEGIVSGEWGEYAPPDVRSREDALRLWDEATARIDELWPHIPFDRFEEPMTAFGTYTAPVCGLIQYALDNEIHHRGQGYVYLRALGIEPPPFWER